MTSRGTPATTGEGRVIDLNLPPARTEGHGLAHVEGPRRCVDLVARAATATSVLLVHVNEMKTTLLVTKFSNTDPVLQRNKVLNVTLETQSVCLRIKRSIERYRVLLGQQAWVSRGM